MNAVHPPPMRNVLRPLAIVVAGRLALMELPLDEVLIHQHDFDRLTASITRTSWHLPMEVHVTERRVA